MPLHIWGTYRLFLDCYQEISLVKLSLQYPGLTRHPAMIP
jgi:hypothetical protein